MRRYLSFFRMRFAAGLQYRTAALAGVLTQFAWGGMAILAFRAFYRADAGAFPMEFHQLSSYLWLQQALLALFMTWAWDQEIFEEISSGNIAYSLVRPLDLYTAWFVKNMALRLSKAVLRCLPILLVASFLPAPYGLSLPAGPSAFLMFLITLTGSFLVAVAFGMLIYISAIYTISSLGTRLLAVTLVEALSGAVVPLPFLPDGVRRVVELLPFASMQNLPLLVYSGAVTGQELFFKCLVQVSWLVLLLLGGKLWLGAGIKKIIIQGG